MILSFRMCWKDNKIRGGTLKFFLLIKKNKK
jgi:hypothetical protein